MGKVNNIITYVKKGGYDITDEHIVIYGYWVMDLESSGRRSYFRAWGMK